MSPRRIKCLIGAEPGEEPNPIVWEFTGISTAEVVDAFACLKRMYPPEATMPPYELRIQADGAPSAPSVRAVTPCGRVVAEVTGSTHVRVTPAPLDGERATLFARCAELMSGRDMIVDALLRWLAPFHCGLPRLLVDISPADIGRMIPPGGARLTLYNVQVPALHSPRQALERMVGTAEPRNVVGSCSLLVAPQGLGLGPCLRLLDSATQYLSPDVRHVFGILRTAAIRDTRLLSAVYEA